MYQNDQTMKNLLIIPALLIVLSAQAQRVNLFLKESDNYLETNIRAHDNQSLYTDNGTIKFAAIDTAKFIEYASFELLSKLNNAGVIYFNAKQAASETDSLHATNKSSASNKKVGSMMKGLGVLAASIGLTLHFPQTDLEDIPTLEESNSRRAIGNGLIIGGGIFVMLGYFVDSE
jgi:hypothetical protein